VTAAAAVQLLASLVLEDGRRWGEAAVPVQWTDARAILEAEVPYHFLTRARGFSKTADLGACAIAALLTQLSPGSRSYGLAADRDQGRLLVDSVLGFTQRTPELAGALDVDSYRVTARRSGATLDVLAADAPGSWGLRPAFVVIDELSAWGETAGPRRLFDAVMSALGKVPGARAVVICSAGDPSHWSFKVLEHARVDALWRTHEVEGAAPWMPADRLEEQRRRLLPSMFRRLFENEWCAGEDRLTTLDDVRACMTAGESVLAPQAGVNYVVSVDLGVTNDRSVVCVCSRTSLTGADGTQRSGVALDRIEVWQPRPGAPVDLGVVEAAIFELHHSYNHSPVVMDPWQGLLIAQNLRARRVPVREFTFSSASVSHLATTLFRLLSDRLLDLPDDDALADELAHVQLRETSPGVYRMDHSPDRHDDRAVALALGAHVLLDAPPRRTLRYRGAA
jgi:hypothetical protein